MFVVLMVVLAATATATFATGIASAELQGSGFAKQRMQVGLIAQSAMIAALEFMDTTGGGKKVQDLILSDTTTDYTGGYPEPELAAGKTMFRLTPEFIMARVASDGSDLFGDTPVDNDSAVGENSAFEAYASIDFTDAMESAFTVPGTDAQQTQLEVTLTARGLLRVIDRDGDGEPDDVNVDGVRGFNQGARDARAYVIMPILK